MYFFTSPVSTINLLAVPHPSPACASIAMSRSDSRDSTTSYTSESTFSTSPVTSWDMRPRSSSSTSGTFNTSAPRRDSSGSISNLQCSWIPSPFRSCLSNLPTEPSSYISDDDLLDLLSPAEHKDLAPPSVLPEEEQEKELTTEEQIAILRAQREKDDLQQRQVCAQEKARERSERTKIVRFTTDSERKGSSGAGRRPSTLKRRSTAVRRNLAMLGN